MVSLDRVKPNSRESGWLVTLSYHGSTEDRSMLIQELLDDYAKGHNPNPVYFYCARSSAEPKRADPESILLNIVKQMSCLEPGGPILGPVRERYEQRKASGSLSLEECTETIINLTKDHPLTTIVLDALDECDEANRSDLLEALTAILQRSVNLIKIFVSSRNDHDIVCQLTDYPNLEIQANMNNEDIVKFVHSEVQHAMRVKKATFGTISTTLKQRVIEVLCGGAQGMSVQNLFLTVELTLYFILFNCSLSYARELCACWKQYNIALPLTRQWVHVCLTSIFFSLNIRF